MLRVFAILILVPVCTFKTICHSPADRVSLLVGDESLNKYFAIEKNSIAMFSSGRNKKFNRPECRLYRHEFGTFSKMFTVLTEAEILRAYLTKKDNPFPQEILHKLEERKTEIFTPGSNPFRPLEGLKVALDPGHLADSMKTAFIEDKYVMQLNPKGRIRKFYEAKLNLATARELKKLLEKDGAEVLLTRKRNGPSAGRTFPKWQHNGFSRLMDLFEKRGFLSPKKARTLKLNAEPETKIRYLIGSIDRPNRTRKINRFRPHITLVLHYNLAPARCRGKSTKLYRIKRLFEKKKNMNPKKKIRTVEYILKETFGIKKNYSLVFVPGWFRKMELRSPRSRLEFLRLMATDHLDESIRLSKHVIRRFEKDLKVEAIPDRFDREKNNRVTGYRGVYARNLQMTRLIQSPLCLGEPLYQNNIDEAEALWKIHREKTPERIAQVASAYHRAVLDYVRELKRKKAPLTDKITEIVKGMYRD